MEDYDDDKVFIKATKAYGKGNFKFAFELFSQAAEQGESWAQNYLGIMYGEGEGVEKDDEKSLYWHKRAGSGHNSRDYYANIALQHERMGNRRRAFYWWNKSIASGVKEAGLELAKRLLQNGRSDSRKRAIELLKIAADAEKQIEISENDKEEAQDLLDDLEKVAS